MSDSENSKQENGESLAPLTAPSMRPQLPPRLSVQQVKDTRDMLVGFREAILEASFAGKHSRNVAMGLEFLNNMVNQAHRDLDAVKAQEKEIRRIKEESNAGIEAVPN